MPDVPAARRPHRGSRRDPDIDAAVLDAARRLLVTRGYAATSIDLIAVTAKVSRPAIYRRWRGKAHLVHEAVFPRTATTELPDTGSLEGDVREMLRRTLMVLSTPAALAALPGLVGEMASDPTLHTALLERFGDVLVGALTDYVDAAARRGDIRPGITAADLAEAVAGMTFLALLTRGALLDETWSERTARLITKGISP